ncbi:MAG: biopolymer transporter ExbD [Pseudobdellovibrio sp.]
MSAGGGNEPNLTPFIDLFSVLICFLLMTAAWIQLETMPTAIEKAPADASTASSQPEPEKKDDKKKIKLEVLLSKDHVVLKEEETQVVVQNASDSFDADRIKSVFAKWRTKYPEKKDIVLSSEATVTYGDLIKMYDLLIISSWPDVGINPQ